MLANSKIYLVLVFLCSTILIYSLINKKEQKEEDALSCISLSISNIEISGTVMEIELLLINSSSHNVYISREGNKLEMALAGTISINGRNFVMENYVLPTVVNANSNAEFKYSCSIPKVLKNELLVNIYIGIMSWSKDGKEWEERETGWILKAKGKGKTSNCLLNKK